MATRRTPSQETFLTTRQAAGRLGVTINAVKAWIRDRHLPALRTPGGHHRIPESDLLEFERKLAADSGGARGHAPRILIVDDDKPLLPVLQSALEQAVPGSVVQVAADGYEALLQVGMFRPDLLVLDLRMPRLDGFEVCLRLKARPATRAIRILAITGYPGEETRERMLSCGADDYLEKPFELPQFSARVLALLPARMAGREGARR